MLTTIPVSSFSKRILTQRYGPQPFKLRRNDFFFKSLCYAPMRPRTNLTRLHQYLTEKIKIDINEDLATRLANNDGYQAGYFLHKLHTQEMLTYISAQVDAGIEAKKSLSLFLAKFQIQEDEYAFESAYKAYIRYSAKKNTSESWTKFRQTVLEASKNVTLPQQPDELEKIVSEFASEIIHSMYTHRGAFRTPIFQQILCYLHINIFKTRATEIEDRYEIPRSSVYYNANAFASKLKAHDGMRQKLLHLIKKHQLTYEPATI